MGNMKRVGSNYATGSPKNFEYKTEKSVYYICETINHFLVIFISTVPDSKDEKNF